MAKNTIERTDYHNPNTTPLVFDQGTSPNDFAERITVLPGETYKGYKNYEKFYTRQGMKKGPSPTAGLMREQAAEAAAEAAQMKLEAEEAKLEALEARREAEAMKAEAQLAIAEAEAMKAKAALIEQVEDDIEDDQDDDPLAPVKAKTGSTKAKTGSKKAK